MKKKVVSLAAFAILSSTAYAAAVSADTHTVKKGETLSHIALKYKLSVTELKKLNELRSDLIFINQTLSVSIPAAPAKTITPSPTPTTTKSTTADVKKYKVVSGDTPSKIASKHKISLADLNAWNNLKSHLIYPGQMLIVSKGQTAPVVSAPATKPVATPVVNKPAAPVIAVPVQTKLAEAASYKIVGGDTLGKISLMHGVTVAQLKKWNGLTSDLIYVGQTLKVSDGTKAVAAPVSNDKPASQANEVIAEAFKHLKVPYVWGGSTSAGFDCSGFIYYVFNKSGMKMGRFSAEGYFNRSYYVDQPQPGDLVFFENTYKRGISHVGIYLGNDEFIHANSSGGVMVSNLNSPYYQKHFDSFKRFY